MGSLIYSMITSLDGYISDEAERFDWVSIDEESHVFVTELTRSVGTYLYGRRMYETMVYWETAHLEPDQPAYALEWAKLWREAEKVVYSTTLQDVASERTRIERSFDPEAIRRVKEESERDITIDGPHLAAQALRAGLVDRIELFVGPAIVGGGHRFFPDGVRLDLDLRDERRFGNGTVFLGYDVKK